MQVLRKDRRCLCNQTIILLIIQNEERAIWVSVKSRAYLSVCVINTSNLLKATTTLPTTATTNNNYIDNDSGDK